MLFGAALAAILCTCASLVMHLAWLMQETLASLPTLLRTHFELCDRYQEGEQVFLTYGNHTNLQLLGIVRLCV